ncbi:MAG: hypothetical protein COA30_01410 [Sulfurimonas sp.]|nr:MAG: hypothetical protein COA30_01410 [Sulfurimonas sp.]
MENTITDFFKIIYSENDFSRGLATSFSGVISSTIYILFNDIVLTLLSLIIVYPISRLLFLSINKVYNQKKENKNIENFFNSFSIQEENLIQEFVKSGTSFLGYNYINTYQNELETLKNRGILSEAKNGYQLNIKVFDKAQEVYKDYAIPF